MTLKPFPIFNNLGISPFLLFFSPKLRSYSQRSYNSKNYLFRTNSPTPRGFELHEFNCIYLFIGKIIAGIFFGVIISFEHQRGGAIF